MTGLSPLRLDKEEIMMVIGAAMRFASLRPSAGGYDAARLPLAWSNPCWPRPRKSA